MTDSFTALILQLDPSDPDVTVTPSASTLTEGESIVITCNYNGVDIVSVNWIFMNRYMCLCEFCNQKCTIKSVDIQCSIQSSEDRRTLQYSIRYE